MVGDSWRFCVVCFVCFVRSQEGSGSIWVVL